MIEKTWSIIPTSGETIQSTLSWMPTKFLAINTLFSALQRTIFMGLTYISITFKAAIQSFMIAAK